MSKVFRVFPKDPQPSFVSKADGVLGDAYMDRVDLVRIKPDFTEQLIKLNDLNNKRIQMVSILKDKLNKYDFIEPLKATGNSYKNKECVNIF